MLVDFVVTTIGESFSSSVLRYWKQYISDRECSHAIVKAVFVALE
jgi:hypothetical protein